MVPRRQKEKHKPFFIYNRVTLAIILLVALLLAMSAIDLLKKEYETRLTRERKEEEFNETVKRKEALEESLRMLESPRGTEAALRSSFSVGREGEEVVILLDPEQPPEPEQPKSFWHTFLVFFGIK